MHGQMQRFLSSDRARILSGHKLGCFVTNFADCFNVFCGKTFMRTNCGDRKPITLKLNDNLIDVTLMRQFPTFMSAVKRDDLSNH